MNQKQSIWYLITKHWNYNLLYVLMAAIYSTVNVFSIYALGKWIGLIAETAQNQQQNTFQLWTILACISLLLSLFSWPVLARYEFFLNIKNDRLLSQLIVSKITSLDYQKYNQRSPGNYLAWYENDFYLIKEDFLDGCYQLIKYSFNVLFVIITLFITSWIMAIIVIVMFITFNLLPWLVRFPLAKISLKHSQTVEVIYNKLLKALDLWTFFSFKNLKTKFHQLFIKNYQDFRQQKLKKDLLNIPYHLLSKIVFILGVSLTFVFGIVLKQNHLIIISSMTTAILLADEIFSLGINNVSLILKFNSVQKVYDKIFKLPHSTITNSIVIRKISLFNQLDINNLSYQYHDQKSKAIDQLTYQFKCGKKYLIMAPSGYGKSTLIKILAGFIKDYQGQILWNSQQELKFIDDQLLRTNISYVDNNNYILKDESFQTNITMWSAFNQKRFDQIVLLLKISDLKNNFDQKKNALSEGEKQKIAIARMLYQNKPIIFLDEALDNIDQQSQKHLIKVFQNLAPYKTLIMVSHNIKKEDQLIFDQVINLDQLSGR